MSKHEFTDPMIEHRNLNRSYINEGESVKEQYATANNFNARVELSRRFSTNQYGWTRWIFDQIEFPNNSRVLELGCGPAYLWRGNLYRVPKDANITLSDFSEGMLKEAKNSFKNIDNSIEFMTIDAQEIPFPNEVFDVIIANHMLYHVPDRKKALNEISRVLKKDGRFYATTIGINNMKELRSLIAACFNREDKGRGNSVAKEFGLENGMEQLKQYFSDVELLRYDDSLEVTEGKPLIDYVMSSQGVSRFIKFAGAEKLKQLEEYIEDILKKEGKIKITKDTGLFIAKK